MQYLSAFEKLRHFKIINLRLREFRNKLLRNTHNNFFHIQDGLVEASTSTLDQLNVVEINLIASLNLGTNSSTKIEKSLSYVHDAISMNAIYEIYIYINSH